MSVGIGPQNSLASYLPEQFEVPEDIKRLVAFIGKRERLTASVMNVREIATYQNNELLTGQQWFSITAPPTPRRPRYSFRNVMDLVALNGNAPIPIGPNAFPHGITGITVPTRIFGTATSAGPLYLPLPYASASGANIEIFFDNTNVNINNNCGASLTQCYVTFEYLKT